MSSIFDKKCGDKVRKKIDGFSKGIFRYERPELLLSTERIEASVVEGEVCKGSFLITNSGQERMRGFLFCADREMELSCQSFEGEQQEVTYSYHTEYLSSGQKREGRIVIVSDLGEAELPYEMNVIEPGFITSIGRVSDLFQFTGLARSDWQEARNLFASERFAAVCLKGNVSDQLLYRGLVQSTSLDQAMEEFLRAIRKKTAVRLEVERKEQEYHLAEKAMKDHIRLRRDGWGYLEVRLEADVPFLQPEKEYLTSEDFMAGGCEVSFVLDPSQMKNGRNVAKLRIWTPDQEIILEYVCYRMAGRRQRASVNYKKKAYEEKLVHNYIQYRMGRMTREQYSTSKRAVLYGLQVIAEDRAAELNRRYPEQIEEQKLLTARRPAERLKQGRELYEQGNHSPLLYLEAWMAWKEAPELLIRLENFEIQVLNWSRKQKLWEESLSSRYVYLAENDRTGRILILHYLKDLYEHQPGREVLNAICTLLLRGENREAEAVWYQRGVEQGLKLTGLYEAYVDTFDWEGEKSLDSKAYTYFWKDNSLNDQRRAQLYAHIIRKKEKKNAIYLNYQKQMENYAREKLKKEEITPELAVLYEDMLKNPDFYREVCRILPGVMFRQLIVCDQADIKAVCIRHLEEEREECVPLEQGRALVDIYSDTVQILLVDKEGRRYAISRPYENRKLMRIGERLTMCYEAGSRDRRLLLALSGRMTRYHKQEIVASELQRELLALEGLEARYRNEIMGELIQYYYDHLEGSLLETHLAEYDLACATEQDRMRILNLMLTREMYVLAGEAMEQYGYAGVSLKYLQRLAGRRISETEEKDAFLLSLCWHLFRGGRADAVILEYLLRYYEGAGIELYEIWEAAGNVGLQTVELEERLLGQMLFTENILVHANSVYHSYEKKMRAEKGGAGKKLLRAFLSYLAYRYLVSDQILDESLFVDMQKQTFYEDTMICKAAALKYYSKRMELTAEEKEFAEIQMERMAAQGAILPFFQEFQGKCRVPAEACHRSFTVYITNPGEEVYIHHRIIDGQHTSPYRMERMKDAFYGIYIKELVLFYGEEMQYYISVHRGDRSEITESMVLELDQNGQRSAMGASGEEESSWQALNLMLIARDMNDEVTLRELMKQYIRQEHVKEKIGKPL